MVLAAKVKLRDAEKAKIKLAGAIDSKYLFAKDSEFLYFPVKKKVPGYTVVERKLSLREKPTLKGYLKGVLSEKELSVMPSSFDALGETIIVDIPDKLKKKEKKIAAAYLEAFPHIKTVLGKRGMHEGEFRTQKLVWLAGKRTKEAVYVENGARIKLDLEKVYFSPRLSGERKRVASLVKDGEEVLVMFSGCGPYIVVIAKNANPARIVGVEINPVAHKYALQNLKLNSVTAQLYKGDANRIVPKLGKFDRIVMPLPKSAAGFLKAAVAVANKNATIHFYDFASEEKSPDESVAKIKAELGDAFKVISWTKCGQHSPGIIRVCVDFTVSQNN